MRTQWTPRHLKGTGRCMVSTYFRRAAVVRCGGAFVRFKNLMTFINAYWSKGFSCHCHFGLQNSPWCPPHPQRTLISFEEIVSQIARTFPRYFLPSRGFHPMDRGISPPGEVPFPLLIIAKAVSRFKYLGIL